MNAKRDYFNALAGQWDELPKPPDTPRKLARFIELVASGEAQDILDVGCGTGLLLGHLQSGKPGRRIVELDVAEQMLVRSRAKVSGPGVWHVCADARRLPFRPGAFDLVLCFNALPHMDPLEDAVTEMLACLKPGGAVAVGHLMASGELNAFHSSLGGAVAGDRLPPAGDLAAMLRGLGAEVILQDEAPGWYLLHGRKAA